MHSTPSTESYTPASVGATRWLEACLWLLLATASGVLAQETESMPELVGEPLALAEIERRTLEHNPEIRQAALAVRAAQGLQRQVGLYPNPTLGITLEEEALESGREGGKAGGFLSQRIVIGGKLRLNRRIFDQEVARAEVAAELARTRELNRVRILFYRAVGAQRLVALHRRLAGLAREAVAVTTQLYNTGAADLPDQLAIEVEAEMLDLSLAKARRELRQLWQQLRTAVGDPALAPKRLEDLLDTDLPVRRREEALERILRDSPEVAFAHLGVRRAELALRRERVEPVPDIEVTAGVVDNREPVGPGGPSVGREIFGDIGIRIPLFNRNQGNIAAARAELERAQSEPRKAELKLEGRFAPIFADYEQEAEVVARFRDRILAKIEQAHRLHLERYRQMAAAYPQVLLSQRTLFEVQAEYVGALTRLRTAVVLLDGMLLFEEPTPAVLDDAVVRRTPFEATGN